MGITISASQQGSGNRFGNYVVEAIIGQGSTASVFRAQRLAGPPSTIPGDRAALTPSGLDPVDLLPPRQLVALKILRKEVSTSPLHVAHFQHEVDLLLSLVHPHIIRLLEHGIIQGRLYAALEYWPGTTLRHLLQQHKQLPRSHALFVTRQVAAALAYAYGTHRVVHRDIKLDNILVDQNWQVKIIDFALASYASGSLEVKSPESVPPRTTSGLERVILEGIAGTLAYAAPEHLRGTSAIDASTDIYSLGICLYEMLVGSVPYLSATPGGLLQCILAHPIDGVLAEMPSIAPDIRVLLTNMLHPNPLMRYSSWPSVVSSLQAAAAERAGNFPESKELT